MEMDTEFDPGENSNHNTNSPKIQRIPFWLHDSTNRNNYSHYFEPKLVSFGPLHHENKKLKTMEALKIKLALLFIDEHDIEEDVLCNEVLKNIEQLKSCYDALDSKVNDKELLARMFLTDGCAVLHYIYCASKKDFGKFKIKNDQACFFSHDLLLLENQLPFQLLQLLINSCPEQSRHQELRESIDKFGNMSFKTIRGGGQEEEINSTGSLQCCIITVEEEEEEEEEEETPAHLLDLFRKCFIGDSKDEIAKDRREKKDCSFIGYSKEQKRGIRCSFRNVSQLKAAGIAMKPNGEKGFVGDIKFISGLFSGTLKLPTLVIDDSTAPKFLNLIALEMCPDFENEFEVSSYICFMNSLIDDRNDVKELREEHILQNDLGSDKEVAILFNKISDGLVLNPTIYALDKSNMQKHYETSWKTWIAIFLHDHFNTPWSALAFVGALIALVLTFVQTWYAIFTE